jgi:hypothetical protein
LQCIETFHHSADPIAGLFKADLSDEAVTNRK